MRFWPLALVFYGGFRWWAGRRLARLELSKAFGDFSDAVADARAMRTGNRFVDAAYEASKVKDPIRRRELLQRVADELERSRRPRWRP